MLQLDRILQRLVLALYTKTTNQRTVDIALEVKKNKRRTRRGAIVASGGGLASNTDPSADSAALQRLYTLLKPNSPCEVNASQQGVLKFTDKDTPSNLPAVSALLLSHMEAVAQYLESKGA